MPRFPHHDVSMRVNIRFLDQIVSLPVEHIERHRDELRLLETIDLYVPMRIKPYISPTPNSLASQRCMNTIDYVREQLAAEDARIHTGLGQGEHAQDPFLRYIQKMMQDAQQQIHYSPPAPLPTPIMPMDSKQWWLYGS